MAPPELVVSRVLGFLALGAGCYAFLLGLLLHPTGQRFALYANRFNTLYWHDLNYPLQWGFADGQVTPFNIQTLDGQTLYAWHVLPLDMYAKNERTLRTGERHAAPVEDFTASLPFQLLTADADPPPRVVISFHGNAGHIAQGWRTDTYRNLAIHPNTHVFTIDYRGFGHSTGSPTEAGLIADGTALVNWVMKVAGIPPERIVLLGQSLGTAVASAVALNFADPTSKLLLHLDDAEAKSATDNPHQISAPTAFAGVILVAPFSNIPSLLTTYRISGLVPLLLPLRPFPSVVKKLTSEVLDQWPSALRLQAYYQALTANPKLLSGAGEKASADGQKSSREMGALQIVHAVDDMDISYRETEYICARVVGPGKECVNGSGGATLFELKTEGTPRFRFEIVDHGGHNRLITYSPVSLAIVRAFEDFPGE